MNIDENINELEKDLKIDELNLKDYALKLPGLKHKWAGRQVREKIRLNKLKRDRDALRKKLFDEVNHQSVVKLSPVTINQQIEKQPSVQSLNADIELCEATILLLEKSEKTLSSITFDLKNVIDVIKLETT